MTLRLSLTISGAVSLGAYEGGALAALIHACRSLAGDGNAAVRIDAIGGASAGSITALLAARCLLEGSDPVDVMHKAWVEDAGIGTLRAHDANAPLSIDVLRDMAVGLLSNSVAPAGPRQTFPVRLVFVLACLRGLDFELAALRATQPVLATTYLDLYTYELKPDTPAAELAKPEHDSPIDAVLASAANELGFPPYLLDRTTEVHEEPNPYAPVKNWPQSNELWYTDGGTVDNEPLGHTLDLTNQLDSSDGECSRLHLLIHPHPTGAPNDDAWADPQRPPTWLETLLRATSLQRTQSLYEDLKQVEKTNSRLSWTDEVVTKLGPVLDGLPDEQRQSVTKALADTLGSIYAQQDRLRQHSTSAAAESADATPDASDALPSELLRANICAAAEVGGKTPAAVEVISPLLLPEAKTTPIDQLLSGEFLFHFGGFLDQKLRQSDFDLGYQSTLEWLASGGLSRDGRLSDEQAAQALDAARSAYQPEPTWRQTGRTTMGSLSALDKVSALRLAGHITHVLAHDLEQGRTQ